MIEKLVRRFGAVRATIILTLITIVISVLIYLPSAIKLGGPAYIGFVFAILTPIILTPSIMYSQLRWLRKLNQAKEALAQANTDLEFRVQERTTKLSEMNKTLISEIEVRRLTETASRQHAQTLSRTNTFITALSRVAAKIGTTLDLDQILETLGDELGKLEITCMVTLLEPPTQTLVIRYSSIQSDVLQKAEQIFNVKMQGFRMKRERFPMWERLIDNGESIFVSDAIEATAPAMPNILRPVIEQVFRMGGWTPEDNVIWLPLTAGNEVKGALGVWGRSLRNDDVPALSVFANQVGIVIENARLYTAERQRSEQQEVMLKEIHHRVKNNLQIISSLLRLQAFNVDNEHLLTMLTESQARIRSMALVHERLYQSGDLSSIDFGEYIRNLAQQLFHTYKHNADRIKLEITVDHIFLDIGSAIPCGLLLNELISNALKHAFPEGREGEISIKMTSKDHNIKLAVSDNGIGLPADFDMNTVNTLGLELVKTLIQQLQGTLKLNKNHGTQFIITFTQNSQNITEEEQWKQPKL
jgi:two-component sensor histidine kinase